MPPHKQTLVKFKAVFSSFGEFGAKNFKCRHFLELPLYEFSLSLSLSLSLSPAASSLEVGDLGSGSCCWVGSDSAAPRGGSCASSSQNSKFE